MIKFVVYTFFLLVLFILLKFLKKNFLFPRDIDVSQTFSRFKKNIFIHSSVLFIMFFQTLLIVMFSNEYSGFSKWIPYLSLPFIVYFIISYKYRNSYFIFLNFFVFLVFFIFSVFENFQNLYFSNLLIFGICQILIIFFGILFVRFNCPKLIIYSRKLDLVLLLLTLFLYLLFSSIFLFELTNFSYFIARLNRHSILTILSSCIVLLFVCLFLFPEFFKNYLNLNKELNFLGPVFKNFSFIRYFIDFFIILAFATLSFRSDSLFEMTVSGNPVYHWNYYVGVINSVQNGGFLLWDVPSQYGFLNILLPVFIKTNSAWQSFYIFQGLLLFITSNIFYFYFVKNINSLFPRLMFFFLIMMSLFFADPDFFGPYPFPSSSVVRFFFVYIILFFLITYKRINFYHAFLLSLIWSLGLWWSSESALYVSAIYLFILFGLIIYCLKSNSRFKLIAPYFILPIVIFLIELSLLVIIYKFKLNIFPDLYAFIEHGLGYAKGFGHVKFSLTGPGFYLLLAFISLNIICYSAIKNNKNLKKEIIIPLFASAGALWAIGSYYFGRPVPQNITAMMPLILIIFLIPLSILNENNSFKFQLNTHKIILIPFLFLILIALFSAHWFNTIRHIESFSGDIRVNLPKSDEDLNQLVQSSEIHSNANIVYYSDEGAQPIFYNELIFLNSIKNDWLPSPLQIMEVPVSKERRNIYLDRHLCLKSNNETFLIFKKNDTINSRADNFIRYIIRYYSSINTIENKSYRVIKFSRFKTESCKE